MIEYKIPTEFVVAFVNDDETHLTDFESDLLRNFEKRVVEQHGIGHWEFGDHDFAYFNDVTDLGCDVTTAFYIPMSGGAA